MTTPDSKPQLWKTALLVVVSLAISAIGVARLSAGDEKKPSQLAKDLVGAWVLVGTPDKVDEVPIPGRSIKFFSGKHWCTTTSEEGTGKVIYHHGGTYILDDDQLNETIEYANENTAQLIKETNKFKVKVEGDAYTQIGVGNPYSQVWKRLK